MLERLRPRAWTLVGVACLVTAAALLALGVPFVQAWLAYLAAAPLPPPVTGNCGPAAVGTPCTIVSIPIWILPSVTPILEAYAVAIPVGFLLAWLVHRNPGTYAGEGGRPRFPRVASALLAGTMGWMSGLIALGLALDGLSIAAPDWLRNLFLASLLAVPCVVAAVGAGCLRKGGWRGLTRRPPAVPG